MLGDERDQVESGPTHRERRRTALIGEIAARLRHVCQHLSDDEFALLVAEIAETRLHSPRSTRGTLPVVKTADRSRTRRNRRTSQEPRRSYT